jgi:hypothetical protein
MSAYRYKPLEGGAIRLLNLEAGHEDQPLRAELQHVHFMDQADWRRRRNPFFEALSYTWGDASITEDLLLFDSIDPTHHALKITFNLANALRKLRYNDRPRWVLVLVIYH